MIRKSAFTCKRFGRFLFTFRMAAEEASPPAEAARSAPRRAASLPACRTASSMLFFRLAQMVGEPLLSKGTECRTSLAVRQLLYCSSAWRRW